MNVYDKTEELAAILKEIPEVIQYREASKKVQSNDNNKKMLEDFREMQIEAYTEQMNDGKISKKTEEKLQKLGSVIMMNPDVSNFIMAEQKFGEIWDKIMKILQGAIGIEMKVDI